MCNALTLNAKPSPLIPPVPQLLCMLAKNITVTIEDGVYRKARRKAARLLDTSVSQVVAAYLRSWTSEEGLKRYRAKKLRNIFALVL